MLLMTLTKMGRISRRMRQWYAASPGLDGREVVVEVASSSMKVLPNKLIRSLPVQDRKGKRFLVPALPIAGAHKHSEYGETTTVRGKKERGKP